MKITVDTNILISATFWYGDSFEIIDRAENKEFELVLSPAIVQEYEEVLEYEEIQEKISKKNLTMKQTVEKIKAMSTLVNPSETVNEVIADPDDNAVLECGSEGNVKYIVTNDKHLLKLKEFKGIKIITPHNFLQEIENKEEKDSN